MKRILILFMIMIPLMAWSQGKSGSTGAADPYINYDELSSLMGDETLMLIDVRTAEEYQSGHIPGSINIPYDTMPSSMPKGSMDKQIVVYCRSGNRSNTARGILNKAGFSNVRDFGGIGNWKAALE